LGGGRLGFSHNVSFPVVPGAPRPLCLQYMSCGATCKAVLHVCGKGHSLYYPLLRVLHFVVLAIYVSLEILTNLANICPVLGVLLVSARPAHDDRTSHF